MFPLFDTHCDTARYIFDNNCSLLQSNGHISLDKASCFRPYFQVAAIWCTYPDKSCAEVYSEYKKVYNYFKEQCFEHNVDLITSKHDLDIYTQTIERRASFILGIEDCGFISDENTLNEVYNDGVRVIIPVWSGVNSLSGAHNTSEGLTALGSNIINKASSLGMVLDVSHASVKSSFEMLEIAAKHDSPIIASHSNSYSVFPHSRNLTDEQILAIKDANGLIGISLCPYHLSDKNTIGFCDVRRHLEHIISICGEESVCLGCDFDGTELPGDFRDISSLVGFYNYLSSAGFSDVLLNKIFFKNAFNKFTNYLK